MKTFVYIVLLSIIPLFSMSLFAQERSFARIVKTNETDHHLLQESKPGGWNAVQVPNFILKNQENKFIMAFGGYIKPIVGWDIGNTLHGSMYFEPSAIPVPAETGNKSEMFINPLHSALDVHVIGLPGTKDQVVGYISISFDGGKNNGALCSLNALYIKYRGMLVGYTYSLFTDVRTLPSTISASGVTGNDWSKGYQIAYNSGSYSGFSFGLSAELPAYNAFKGAYEGKDYPEFDGDALYGNATQAVPDIPFYLQYGWSGWSHVRLSGVLRNFKYVDKLNDKARFVTGMGVKLSTVIELAKPLGFMGQVVYGKGIGNYISGLQYVPYSFLPDDKHPGKMRANNMLGWFGSLRYDCSKRVNVSLTYGQSRIYNADVYDKGYRYGQDFRANVDRKSVV